MLPLSHQTTSLSIILFALWARQKTTLVSAAVIIPGSSLNGRLTHSSKENNWNQNRDRIFFFKKLKETNWQWKQWNRNSIKTQLRKNNHVDEIWQADKPAKPLRGSRGDNPTTGAGSCIVTFSAHAAEASWHQTVTSCCQKSTAKITLACSEPRQNSCTSEILFTIVTILTACKKYETYELILQVTQFNSIPFVDCLSYPQVRSFLMAQQHILGYSMPWKDG